MASLPAAEADLRKLALSLPETREDFPWGESASTFLQRFDAEAAANGEAEIYSRRANCEEDPLTSCRLKA